MPPAERLRLWPVDLLDEILRLEGRFRSTFADFRRETGLNESEMMVLNAVCVAERPPTVSQIGRSTGNARQLIQRSANSLVAANLLRTVPNPDHKRAVLLQPTDEGLALKEAINRRAAELASALQDDVDVTSVYAAIEGLQAVRRTLEAHQRNAGR
jgi:DNA-binding MarR family transcriptional regulator